MLREVIPDSLRLMEPGMYLPKPVHFNRPVRKYCIPHQRTWRGGGPIPKRFLELESHTGDPDLIRIDDWWYMFVDTGRHKNYSISYARTTVSDFPNSWEFKGKAIGPNEGNQTWDSPRKGGNRFGIGDADVILENETVYMVYERPVGVAYRNIERAYIEIYQLFNSLHSSQKYLIARLLYLFRQPDVICITVLNCLCDQYNKTQGWTKNVCSPEPR